jgi:homoserine O-acetyltransferase
MDYQIFDLGHVPLQRGATLRDAKLAYKTYGTLNAARDNVIVYPTWYSGQHQENEWLIGKGMALDPGKYFIVVPSALGNGLSSSPSNTPEPYNKARFPEVTLYDNVTLQHRLITEAWGISKVKLAVGWSMGRSRPFNGERSIRRWSSASSPSPASMPAGASRSPSIGRNCGGRSATRPSRISWWAIGKASS